MSEPDLALTGRKATLEGVLDLGELQLIGLMQAHDGPAALLRSAAGDYARVKIGDEAFGKRVLAIDGLQVVLADTSGQSQVLLLPAG